MEAGRSDRWQSSQLQVENSAEGHKVLLEWLRRHKVKRIGIEASGGYELPVVIELRRKRFVVVVFQPAQVRAYAKFHSQLAKNDKLDAALIAACTAAVKKIHDAPDPRLQPFAEHLTLIEQIGEDIKLYKNRVETCRDPRIQKLWKEEIAAWPSAREPNSRPWWPRSANIATSPNGSI